MHFRIQAVVRRFQQEQETALWQFAKSANYMEQIKEISLFMNIAGGLAKGIEVLHNLYEYEKNAHKETKAKLEELEKTHEELLQKHEDLKKVSPSLDTHK